MIEVSKWQHAKVLYISLDVHICVYRYTSCVNVYAFILLVNMHKSKISALYVQKK